MILIGSLQSGFLPIEKNVILIILFSFVIGLSYLIIQPFIKWFVTLKSVKLLSYIICSLVAVLLCFLIAFFVEGMQHYVSLYLKITLQGIAFFGIALFVIFSIQHLKKSKQKSV